MDKEKFIKWLNTTCGELDGLACSGDDIDSTFFTAQLCFAQTILNLLETSYFDKEV